MTQRRSTRRAATKGKPLRNRGQQQSEKSQTRDREGRLVLRTLEDAAKEKSLFIERLEAIGMNPALMADTLKKLRTSIDPRVVMGTVEFEARIRGWDDKDTDKGKFSLVINIGVPEIRRAAPVVAQPPALPSEGGQAK